MPLEEELELLLELEELELLEEVPLFEELLLLQPVTNAEAMQKANKVCFVIIVTLSFVYLILLILKPNDNNSQSFSEKNLN